MGCEKVGLYFVLSCFVFCNCSEETGSGIVYVLKQNLFSVYTLQSDAVQDELCRNQSRYYNEHLLKGSQFAVNMFDASSKIPSGILAGRFADFGRYDQCVGVSTPLDNEVLTGKHCITTFSADLKNIVTATSNFANMSIDSKIAFTNKEQIQHRNGMGIDMRARWSICVPSVCPALDIKSHLQTVLAPVIRRMGYFNVTILLQDSDCQDKSTTEISMRPLDWAALNIFSLMGLLILTSTGYDFFLKKSKDEGVFSIFSLRRSYHELTKISENSEHFHCLNGLRWFSMMWVILGHRYVAELSSPVINSFHIFEWIEGVFSDVIYGGTLSVDNFFVMSGMLLMYMYMKQATKGRKFNIPMLYFQRYLRLTPPLLALLLFLLTFFQRIGSGPVWLETINPMVQNCNKYWWSSLLYIQNIVNPMQTCMPHTWYLSTDMQMFWVAPFIIIPIYKRPKIGLLILAILGVFCITVSLGLAYFYKIKASFFNTGQDFFSIMYFPIYTRGTPFLMGIVLGYSLFKQNGKQITINKILVFCMWFLAMIVLGTIVFMQHQFNKSDFKASQLSNIAFVSLHRTIWSGAICWILFACINGYGGLINWFLSLRIFQVLARLTYCMYLVHYFVIYARVSAVQVIPYFTDMSTLFNYAGDLVLTLLLATFWSLIFEIPFINLQKYIMSRGSTDEKRMDKITPVNNIKLNHEVEFNNNKEVSRC